MKDWPLFSVGVEQGRLSCVIRLGPVVGEGDPLDPSLSLADVGGALGEYSLASLDLAESHSLAATDACAGCSLA